MTTETQPNEVDAGADDTANLLSEFDKSSDQRPGVETPKHVQPTAEDKPVDVPLTFEQRLRQRMQERDQRLADALKRKDAAQTDADRSLAQRLEAIENERAAERQAMLDRADAEAVFGQAAEMMDEIAPHIPKEFVQTWFSNQVQLDSDLLRAWQTRYDGEAEMRNFHRKVNSALKKFGKYLRSLPDPAVTDDRTIVAASVRGSGGPPPPPAAPKYSAMSDAEYASHVEKQYGFRPKL
jgi:hypothetical protein